ncbi:tagatose-6-phosphate ketose isomerase [Massilia phosphatilytica]|nr:tagatose-6-phosphate ketose isomerase [Massilia phosphatilytica]
MTTLLERDAQSWRDLGGLATAEEIVQQPAVWRALAGVLAAHGKRVADFLGACLDDPHQRVILTGAGSSAYVGEIAAGQLNAGCAADVRALATTSLLTHHELYLDPAAPTLLVSFARSGDSPESLAAVNLVRSVVPGARFLHITCNAAGSLATQAAGDPAACVLLMPPASCDRGFAMTSSFTSMLLAALCVLSRGVDAAGRLDQLAQLGERALADWSAPVARLAERPAQRVVYLGSGPLEALAKEAALKILELTGGRILALAESPLGFRHGPKSVLDEDSQVILFASAKPLARRYDDDLLAELRRDGIAADMLTVGAGGDFAAAAPAWPDAWLAPLWLLMAQQYALQQSVRLRLRPDNPFAGGIVNRVVQGVTIHDHAA